MIQDLINNNIERAYTICGDPYRFFITGAGSTGDQYLVVLQEPYFIVSRFDNDGNLLDSFAKKMYGLDSSRVASVELCKTFSEMTDPVLREFLGSVSFVMRSITTKKFFLKEYSIGIMDFPKAFMEYLSAPSNFSLDEITIAQTERDRWKTERLYELWLGHQTNLWMKASGERESS
jgi:hypothetical protein